MLPFSCLSSLQSMQVDERKPTNTLLESFKVSICLFFILLATQKILRQKNGTMIKNNCLKQFGFQVKYLFVFFQIFSLLKQIMKIEKISRETITAWQRKYSFRISFIPIVFRLMKTFWSVDTCWNNTQSTSVQHIEY